MESIIAFIGRKGIPYVTLNVDAPDSGRLCYIGPDYREGGRLAAEYIGKTLLFKKNPRMLVITTPVETPEDSSSPDINHLRYEGFLSVMRKHFGRISHEVGYLTTDIRSKEVDRQIADLLASSKSRVDAIYFIPAFNAQFVQALERSGFRENGHRPARSGSRLEPLSGEEYPVPRSSIRTRYCRAITPSRYWKTCSSPAIRRT